MLNGEKLQLCSLYPSIPQTTASLVSCVGFSGRQNIANSNLSQIDLFPQQLNQKIKWTVEARVTHEEKVMSSNPVTQNFCIWEQ